MTKNSFVAEVTFKDNKTKDTHHTQRNLMFYVCMYVCMCVCVCVYIYIEREREKEREREN